MPPLGGVFKGSAGDARVHWLADGYPGRESDGQIVPHPMFGAYALADYLQQYSRAPSPELRDALQTVAGAVLARLEPHKDALVFWYAEDGDISRSTQRHYSGLTQGYYAINLARAAKVLNDPQIADAAHRVFAALTISVADGGVCSEGQLGPSIAQVAQEPTSYILNGWQSALASIFEFADVTGREDARQLANDSAREMARLLPLYDAPTLRNSRYGLTGFVYVRLVLRGPQLSQTVVDDICLDIPGERRFPVDRLGGRRYDNHVLEKDVAAATDGRFVLRGNVLRINVVLSRISFPLPNRFQCTLTCPGGTVEVQVQEGRYDPLAASPADREWVTVARVDCPAGTSRLDVGLPWDVTDLVAYPTNFKKVIGGEQTNVYHMTHIRRLRELADATGLRELREWANTWTRYVGAWGSMPEYQGLHVRWGKGRMPVADAKRALPFSAAEPWRD
jgi:hypothetical protein